MVLDPKAVVQAFVQEFQGGRDEAVLNDLLSPGFVDHSPTPGLPAGAEGIRQLFHLLWAGLPDLRVEIHHQIAEGDLVATHKSFVGTHDGDLFGVPPTGRAIRLDLIDVVRVVGGEISEHWNVVDTYGLLRQLGALPA